jgi:hypothetical protein
MNEDEQAKLLKLVVELTASSTAYSECFEDVCKAASRAGALPMKWSEMPLDKIVALLVKHFERFGKPFVNSNGRMA